MTMGDRVAVPKDGLLQQVATPREIYDRPANAFVAGFIGPPAMNLRDADLVEGGARLGDGTVPLPTGWPRGDRSRVRIGIRPEALDITGETTDGITLVVALVEELGSDTDVYATLAGEQASIDKPIVVRVDGRTGVQIGDKITVAARPGEVHLFDPDTGARLG